HLPVERVDLILAHEFAACRQRPGAFVPARKDEMRPILAGRLRDGEKLNPRIWMIAPCPTLYSEAGGNLFEPAEKQRARHLDRELVRPSDRLGADLPPALFPTQSAQGVLRWLQEFDESGARGQQA